jgi:hypothetical protein
MPLDDRQLCALLRLKKFEQPPPRYFEDFLREFQSRQREEMLRRSFWQIAWDRLQAFFGDQAVPRLSYAGAVAAVMVVAAVTSWQILTPAEPTPTAASENLTQSEPSRVTAMAADPETFREAFRSGDFTPATLTASSARPRYVMDARPVSYEPPSSF